MLCVCLCFVFCVKQKTAYEMRISDWSSDVCSSDLGPQEILRLLEAAHLGRGKHLALHQRGDVVDVVEELGDPEQRVQVAQAALALLDVGLELVARAAEAVMPRLALAELGLDKLGGATRLHVLLEALAKLAVERLVAPEPARLQ